MFALIVQCLRLLECLYGLLYNLHTYFRFYYMKNNVDCMMSIFVINVTRTVESRQRGFVFMTLALVCVSGIRALNN